MRFLLSCLHCSCSFVVEVIIPVLAIVAGVALVVVALRFCALEGDVRTHVLCMSH